MDGGSDDDLLDGNGVLVDGDVLMALREFRVPDEADPAEEVAQAFFEVTPARLQHLQTVAQQGDAEEVRRIAHQMRGSCSTVGATAMYAVAAEIETHSRDADVTPLVVRLAALYARTQPLLDAIAHGSGEA